MYITVRLRHRAPYITTYVTMHSLASSLSVAAQAQLRFIRAIVVQQG